MSTTGTVDEEPGMTTKKKVVLGAAAAVVLLVAVGLGVIARPHTDPLPAPSNAFCAAARRYDDKLPKLAGATKFDEQIELVTPMAEHAPKDIRADAEIFLDALERRAAGDKSVADDPKVKEAIDNVNRRSAQGCDFYKPQPGQGGM